MQCPYIGYQDKVPSSDRFFKKWCYEVRNISGNQHPNNNNSSDSGKYTNEISGKNIPEKFKTLISRHHG